MYHGIVYFGQLFYCNALQLSVSRYIRPSMLIKMHASKQKKNSYLQATKGHSLTYIFQFHRILVHCLYLYFLIDFLILGLIDFMRRGAEMGGNGGNGWGVK